VVGCDYTWLHGVCVVPAYEVGTDSEIIWQAQCCTIETEGSEDEKTVLVPEKGISATSFS
jgi:hypothetical protein